MADVAEQQNKKPAAQAKTVVQSSSKQEREQLNSVRKSALFLAGVVFVGVLYVILSGQLEDFIVAMAGVDVRWVLLGALCMVCYFFLGVMGYAVPVSRDRTSPLGFRDLMSTEAAGIFFSYLTPASAGSAPSRIYHLTRAGLTVGSATALQFIRYVIYEAAEGIFAAIMLIFRYQYFVETVGNFAVVGMILFLAKIVEVAGLLAVCLCPKVVKRLGNSLIRIVEKTPVQADFAHWYEVVNVQVQEFSMGFKESAKDLPMMGFALFISMSQLACQYSIGWFVAHAFGFHDVSYITCLAAGAMLELLTSAVPLPGGEGGAEVGFAMLFGPIFGSSTAAAYVVWRFLEYVGPIFAAMPLMGLRSRGGRNIYQHLARIKLAVSRFLKGLPRPFRRAKAHRRKSTGDIRVSPNETKSETSDKS